jgi:hypothetical protein
MTCGVRMSDRFVQCFARKSRLAGGSGDGTEFGVHSQWQSSLSQVSQNSSSMSATVL